MLISELLGQTKTYNQWANGEFLSFLQSSAEPSVQAAKVFAHLLLAELTWLRRMSESRSDNTGFNFWTGETVKDCTKLFEQSREEYEKFFNPLTEERLETVFAYKNSRGVAFENTCREALTHVFTHSAYHRGQMAQSIRAGGDAPPNTDFIHFLRIS
ncbi:MAG: DinB family protein [Pyrinomonadaceae bacterium]